MKFELSLSDLKEFFSGKVETKEGSKKQIGADINIGNICLIRTYSAGVHFGIVEEYSDCMTVVRLSNARRIWNWNDANTLSEVSKNGVSSNSKISEEVETITISGVIEIIPMTDKAITCLKEIKWS